VTSKNDIRKQVRLLRRSLSVDDRHQHAASLYQHFHRHQFFRNSQRIAMYLSNDGELDLTPLILRAFGLKKRVFLPALHKPGYDRMVFIRYTKKSPMRNNRFGIAEPRYQNRTTITPRSLDLVLMPLVAFDKTGNRLGMGGGFYDRTFAFLGTRKHWHKPRLIGVAYDFQLIDDIPHEPWDVPLDGVVTPTTFYAFKK